MSQHFDTGEQWRLTYPCVRRNIIAFLHSNVSKECLTFTTLWANSSDKKLIFFPRKQHLTFHANCLRQFAWNVKSCFLGKIRKNTSICRMLKFLPRVLSVKVCTSGRFWRNCCRFFFFDDCGSCILTDRFKAMVMALFVLCVAYRLPAAFYFAIIIVLFEGFCQALWSPRWRKGRPLRKYAYISLTPLNPTLCSKTRFTGVYIIFLISAKKHKLWVLVRTTSVRRF